MSYKSSIKLPFTSGKRLILGWILHFIPILNIFSLGYLFNIMESTIEGKTMLSPWERWANMFLRGVQMLVIAAIWVVPATFAYLYLTGWAATGVITAWIVRGSIPDPSGALILATLIVPLLFAYFMPQALVDFVREKRFKSAFKPKTIVKQTLNIKYLSRWLVSVAVYIVYFLIVSYLAIPIGYVAFSLIPHNVAAALSAIIVNLFVTAGGDFMFLLTSAALISGLYSKVIVPPRPRVEEDIKDLKESAEELKDLHEDVIEGDEPNNTKKSKPDETPSENQ